MTSGRASSSVRRMRSPPGTFARARVAGIVLEDDDVASEKRSVRTAQVQEHAVMTGHRYDRHLGHDRRFPRDALRHETLPANSARRKIRRTYGLHVSRLRASTGHAAAAPPSSVMNSRRLLIRSPRRQAQAACQEFGGRAPLRWRAILPFEAVGCAVQAESADLRLRMPRWRLAMSAFGQTGRRADIANGRV
jgi:hypothetical protein